MMRKKGLFCVLLLFFFSNVMKAQEGFASEEALKEKAEQLFEAKELVEATPLYAQLLSLYPKDPNYNFKYGACLIASDADKEKAIKYLKFAISKPETNPLAYYYLARALHLNYDFAKAVKQYGNFKRKASSKLLKEYDVDRQIEMCKNGNQLLSKLNEVQVIDKQEIAEKDFYRIYQFDELDGKIIAKPKDFQSKHDRKTDEQSVIYLPENAREVYYSSYGKKGESGRDIYKSIKLGNGSWSEGVNIGNSINTPYDENYPFIHPDGRTLYFASKGHNSMGGYDLFKSVFDQTTGQWSTPENLDFAFNSTGDDVLFITDRDQKTAYFASNRNSPAGKLNVYKVLVERAPAELSAIKGKFITEDFPDLKKAKVTVVHKASNETVGVFETDNRGNYTIEIPKNGGDYQFNIETTADAPIHTGLVSIPKQDEFQVLAQELRLVSNNGEQQLVIKNIFDGSQAESIASNQPQVSSSTLKKKADLEVNYSQSDLAALERERQHAKGNSVDARENQTKTESSGVDKSQLESSDDGESLARSFEKDLQSTTNKLRNNLKEQKRLNDFVFSKAAKLAKNAEEAFQTGNQGGSKVEVNKAQTLASKSALSMELARELERNFEEVKQLNDKFVNDSADLANLIEQAEFDMAEQKAKELENYTKLIQAKANVQNIIENRKNEAEKKQTVLNDQIAESKEKIASLDREIQTKQPKTKALKNKISQADEEDAAQLQKQLSEINLDIQDLKFQKQREQQKLNRKVNEHNAFNLKEELIAELNQELETNVPSTDNLPPALSDVEKQALEDQLKTYRENDQLAFISSSTQPDKINQAEGTEEFVSETSVTDDTDIDDESDAIPSPESKEGSELMSDKDTKEVENYEQLNQKYEEALAGISDEETEATANLKKQEIYKIWKAELENAMMEKEAELSTIESEQKRISTQSDINRIQEKIDQLTDLSETEADLSVGEDVAAADRKIERKDEPSASTETSAVSTTEEPISFSVDVSQVDDETIVDDSFTSLNFEQDYSYGNQKPSQSMAFAKKSLFEAGKIAEAAEKAKQSAFTLPTAEERSKAFELANKLEKQSEAKQLEAAQYFAQYNAEEYQINNQRIENANQFESEFESQDLDIANLLAEEADLYFNKASNIRAEINPEDRLSKKEAKLQQAYDFEMLALKKQRQALSKLSLVDDKILKDDDEETKKEQAEFVQAITDPQILSISSAELAAKKSDSALLAAEEKATQAAEVQTKLADLSSGTKKDSLTALFDSLSQEVEKIKTLAAVYYEREKQIKSGIPVQAESAKNTSQAIKPFQSNYLTEVNIDTVNIDESRKEELMASNSFRDFIRKETKYQSLLKEAEVDYQLAAELDEEANRLRKEAIILNNRAELETDPTEKERIIKAAQVITQKAKRNRAKVDSLNTRVKVKNFLIAQAAQQNKALLNQLEPAERLEFAKMRSTSEADSLIVIFQEQIQAELAARDFQENEITAQETSNSPENLEVLSTDREQPGAEIEKDVPVQEEQIESQTESGSTEEIGRPESSEIVETEPDVKETEESIDAESNQSESQSSNAVPTITETEPSDRRRTTTDSEPSIANNEPNPAADETESTSLNTTIPLDRIDEVPRVIKQAIFVRLNNASSAYNSANPIPEKSSLPEGLVYKVQVGAYRNPIPQNLFKGFAPIMAEKAGNGITRYTAGLFLNQSTALTARDQIRKLGYPDAFLVAFLNGERISLSQAGELETGELADSAEESSQTSSEVEPVSNQTDSEELSSVFEGEKLAPVLNAKKIDKLFFTVQIGVYSKPLEQGVFDYENLNVVELPSGLIRYNVGVFENAIDAAERQIEIQSEIPDAFVTAYYRGKRISINEAARLKNR